MNKKILWLMFIIVLLPICFADLNITNSSFSSTIYTNQPQTINIPIKNDYNFTIYNLSMTGLKDFTFSGINQLAPSETKNFVVEVKTNTSYTKSLSSTLIFLFKGNISLNPTDSIINVTANGYYPQQITVIQGSNITWNNKDTISHTLTSTLWDYSLASGEVKKMTFDTPGVIDYFDRITNYYGKIIVLDKLSGELIHNPIYDKTISFSVNSVLVETVLELSTLENDSIITPVNENTEMILLLKNIGNQTSYGIRLNANWATFSKNDFSVDSNKLSYITASFNPALLSAEETNKSYSIAITVNSNNTLPMTKNVSIFVPYKLVNVNSTITEYFNQTFSEDFLIKLYNVLCKAYPNATQCQIQTVEKIVYRSEPVPYNYTQDSINEINRAVIGTKEEMSSINNYFKTKTDELTTMQATIRDSIVEQQGKINYMQNVTEQNQTDINNFTAFFIIFIVFVLLLGVMLFSGKKIIDYFKRRAQTRT